MCFSIFLNIVCRTFRNDTTLIGKEIVTRFEVSNFQNEGIFYTDSNGKEMIRRSLHSKDKTLDEPVSSNYYPVTSKILIRDEKKNLEVAILNDRCQGGTSLLDGKIELMVSYILRARSRS